MFTRYLNNCGRPESNKLGWFVLKSMNKGHAYIYRWLLDNVHLPESGIVLDVGCGGGALMERILNEFPSIKTYGIDISDESVPFLFLMRHSVLLSPVSQYTFGKLRIKLFQRYTGH